MLESTKNYLLWLKERGLEDFLPHELSVENSVDEVDGHDFQDFDRFIGSKPSIIFIVHSTSSKLADMPTEEKLLLGKLVKSIGYTFDQIALFSVHSELSLNIQEAISECASKFQIQPKVFLGSQFKSNDNAFNRIGGSNNVMTYAPWELLENEGLKRPTWELLKAAFPTQS